VCRCLEEDSRRYLEALIHEQVTDHATRVTLRGSHGCCAWHAAMLADTASSGFGSAILVDDLLARATRRVREAAGRPALAARWLPRLRSSGRRRARGTTRRGACPACAWIESAEERYLGMALRLGVDKELEHAFEASDGLCVPHVERLVARHPAAPGLAEIVEQSAAKWERLLTVVQAFRDKHDHRSRAPISEAESQAWRLALAMLAGGSGVFGNDLRRSDGDRRRD